jgi:hypothetical protein
MWFSVVLQQQNTLKYTRDSSGRGSFKFIYVKKTLC